MACCLFNAKPLSKPMLICCQLDSWEQVSVKLEMEFYHFHSRKMRLKMLSAEMVVILSRGWVNTLRPNQTGHRFADDTFKRIFLNGNVIISIKISLKFIPHGPINNIPALVQIMAWRRPGDKSLSEPMMVRLPTHICVTRPQWVKG